MQVPMYPPIPSPLPRDAILYAVTGGTPGVPDVGDSGHLIAEQLLDITAVTESWDMTPTDTVDVTPNNANSLEATFTETDPANYEMTPAAGASIIKQIGSVSGIVATAMPQQMRVKAPNVGGNFAGMLAIITNAEATAAEVTAALQFSGALGGNLTHFACAFLPYVDVFGPGTANAVTFFRGDANNPAGGTNVFTTAGFAFTPGTDDLFFELDGAIPGACTLSVLRSSDGGTTVDATQLSTLTLKADDVATSLRLTVGQYFFTATPTFPDGTMNFDFSAAATGGVPFAFYQAALPANARDGRKYEVTVGGSFAGKTTLVGDVVELKDAMSDIVIYRLITQAQIDAYIAAWVAANPQVSLLSEARNRATMLSIANNAVAATVRGDCHMVGASPSGLFAGFAHGNVAVWDGASAYVQFAPSSFIGVDFIGVDPNFNQYSIRYIPPGTLSPGQVLNNGSAFGYLFSDLQASFGWFFNKLVKIGLPVRAPTITLVDGQNTQVALGAADTFTCLVPPNSICGIDFGGPANGRATLVILPSNQFGVGETARVNLQFAPFPIVFTYENQFPVYLDVVEGGQITGYREFAGNAWTPTTDAGSVWVNEPGNQASQYRRDRDIVSVRGTVYQGVGQHIFTLPLGHRPPAQIDVNVTVRDGSDTVVNSRAVLGTNGTLTILQPIGIIGSHKVGYGFSFSTTP